jgi:Family of unknown function (DUF6334)
MIALTRRVGSLDPLLLPDRDEPYRLHDVFEKIVDGCRDEIVLDFGDSFLRFSVNADTDTIVGKFHGGTVVAKRGYRSIRSAAPWRQYLNKECGWTWLAINQQGYWDTILISFDAVVPNILLNVMASSIYVFAIGPMEKIVPEKAAKPKNNKKISR